MQHKDDLSKSCTVAPAPWAQFLCGYSDLLEQRAVFFVIFGSKNKMANFWTHILSFSGLALCRMEFVYNMGFCAGWAGSRSKDIM